MSSFAECKTEGVREFGFILSAALGAPFILWRTNIRQNELEIKKKMQVNDAYHNAINQLGAVNIVNNEQIKAIDIRLGSMYTLEKIAQDHEDYHNQIMEVLCAYIRTQKSFPHNLTFDSLNQIHNSGQFSAEDDINTALQVIGRRNVNHDQNLKLNFTCCDLSFARFVGDFKFAIFTYSVLNFVTFKCDLSHASMNKCLLLGTDFTDSISEDCDIARSFIRKITISDPQFLRMRNWKVSCRPENLKHGASIPYPDQSMRNRFDTPTLMKELKL